MAFRVAPSGTSEAERDRLNRELLSRINAHGRVYLTGSTLSGRFAIRIYVLSFRTHRERMEAGLEDVREAVAAVVRR